VSERLDHGPQPLEPRLDEFLRTLNPGPIHPSRFLVRDARSGLYFVRADEIDWVEASGNYVTLHAGGRTHLVRDTMNEFMEKLDPALFVRVHRSAIVHLDRIVRIEPAERGEYRITLRDGAQLNTSRAHSERLRALLQG
jgi:two-component system LytT family response regulator